MDKFWTVLFWFGLLCAQLIQAEYTLQLVIYGNRQCSGAGFIETSYDELLTCFNAREGGLVPLTIERNGVNLTVDGPASLSFSCEPGQRGLNLSNTESNCSAVSTTTNGNFEEFRIFLVTEPLLCFRFQCALRTAAPSKSPTTGSPTPPTRAPTSAANARASHFSSVVFIVCVLVQVLAIVSTDAPFLT
jgi:hypothetical protein